MLLQRLLRNQVACGICAGLLIGVVIFAIIKPGSVKPPALEPAAVSRISTEAITPVVNVAELEQENPSPEVRYIVEWISQSGDTAGAPFVIVDKKDAKIYVFNRRGRLRGASPVLLGSAKGDDTVFDIGLRPIAEVLADERTTPAGRFRGQRGENARGEDVVWVDYDAAVSMHRVLTTQPEEERLARLASPTPDDNRISYGCINVPVEFYEAYLQPTFANERGIVYVLPEVKRVEEVFPSFNGLTVRTRPAQTPHNAGSRALMILLLAIRAGGKA